MDKSMNTAIGVDSSYHSDCCIYKVPKLLRDGNEKLFTPRVVSIGPLHEKDTTQEEVETLKFRYMEEFMRRTKLSLEELNQIVKDQEQNLRNCYTTDTYLGREFVNTILFDSVFIVEFLLRLNKVEYRTGVDHFFNRPHIDIGHDLILLENQLPFYLLEDLYERAERAMHLGKETTPAPFVLFALGYLQKFAITSDIRDNPVSSIPMLGDKVQDYICTYGMIKHFLDLLRVVHLPRLPSVGKSRRPSPWVINAPPSITELNLAGVKFADRYDTNIFTIRFDRGTLKLPMVSFDESTGISLANLLAFERCHCEVEDSFFNDYVIFMGGLVNTSMDVDILKDKGLRSYFKGNSTEIASTLNNIAKNAYVDPCSYYADLSKQLCDCSHNCCSRWKASLMQNYFNSPWSIITIIATSIGLILTVMQTVFAVIHK